MTAHALTDSRPPSAPPEVWDVQRLASLLADVGEAGLRDVLRLFMADLPYLLSQFEAGQAAEDADAADAVLAVVLDSAETLGLAALAARVRGLRAAPLAPDGPRLLASEAARIRFVPSLKHAS
ncbi:hypothetical protein [Aestuariivirga sp.]|uniref:hypothetical protein n=1 Tax=Aestuariivirga sp. TaxID=2650926 RepID=UPI0025BA8B31|nr:hypothetical protein [Aestuariivirga sp.]MCA3554072.1 hypothetical protein [Aestuariivirga sp.]